MYRQMRNYENLNKAMFPGVGEFDIPQLPRVDIVADEFIGFNYAKTCKRPENVGVHFFLDDYQFARVWERPDAYIAMLQRFQCVCTPDFSMYTDFPKAIQIYNHYRKHWLGAYWQANGITVIPTIAWSDAESFDWCFDGEPTESVVAISSVGTLTSEVSRSLFVAGYREMTKRLRPTTVIFYGSIPDECANERNVTITAFQNTIQKRL